MLLVASMSALFDNRCLSLHIAFFINVTSARVLTEGVIIDQQEGILESSIPEEPFVKNVYRRSLALVPLVSAPRGRFPGVQFYSLLTDRHTLLSERLQQAEVTRVVMSYITYIHTYMFYLFGVLYNK